MFEDLLVKFVDGTELVITDVKEYVVNLENNCFTITHRYKHKLTHIPTANVLMVGPVGVLGRK